MSTFTPAAMAQIRADNSAFLDRIDAAMCKVLTKYAPEPIPVGEATDSTVGDLIEAVRDDPLRRHFEDDEGDAS